MIASESKFTAPLFLDNLMSPDDYLSVLELEALGITGGWMTDTAHQSQQVAWAVLAAAMAALLFSADAVVVRQLGGALHPFVIGFFRALFGAIAVLPLVLAKPDLLRSAYPLHLHAFRAGLKLLALVAFFAAFSSQEPLANVTAIAFTSPIFVVIGASLALRERLRFRRLLALAVGFSGAMVIVGPAGGGLSLAIGMALAGAVMQSVIQLMLKSMSNDDPIATLVLLNLFLTVPIALLLALPFWTRPELWQLALLALQGVLGAASMALMTHAYSLADASIVAPVDFLRLPFVALLGYLVFGEISGLPTWIGGGLICTAALLASHASRLTVGVGPRT